MIANIYSFILHAGIGADTRPYLARNLKATSLINMGSVAIISTSIVAAFGLAVDLVPLLISALLCVLLQTSLQVFGFHVIARMLTANFVCLVSLLFHNLIACQLDKMPVLSFSVCALLSTSPFFLFSFSELRYSIASFGINIAALISSLITFRYFKTGADLSTLGAPLSQAIIFFSGMSLISVGIIALQALNRRQAIQVKQLARQTELEKIVSAQKQKELNELITKLQAAQAVEQRRLWANKGIADLGKILRTDENLETMANQVVSFLVKYTASNQGALFLLHETDGNTFFQMTACYAYDRKKFIDKKISVGEGLLGECYFDRAVIHLTTLPDRYTYVTGGLGQATPKSLLIVPLLANEVMMGAFEFASFNLYDQHQIEFLQEAAENTASILTAIRSNQQTKILLEESQQLAEQMKAQEEEMRQNMEELAATQEQQQRTESALKSEIDKKNQEIEAMKKRLLLFETQMEDSRV